MADHHLSHSTHQLIINQICRRRHITKLLKTIIMRTRHNSINQSLRISRDPSQETIPPKLFQIIPKEAIKILFRIKTLVHITRKKVSNKHGISDQCRIMLYLNFMIITNGRDRNKWVLTLPKCHRKWKC